jgi:succinate dehydrogenase/fumarate reductase flavoprotein subunit
MKRLSADVAIIGTGGAGMMAALAAAEQGVDVLIVGKAAVGRGTCTSFAGGFFTSSSLNFSKEQHYETTLEVGRHINDLQLVDLITQRGAACLEKLSGMGVRLLPMGNGFRVDNQDNEKLIPGYPLVNSMRHAMDARDVKSLPGFHCLELIIEDDAVAGILGVTAEGPAVISAPSVILATGGAGAIYLRNDNPMGITGDGYTMALKAGCRLRDMEFVQFYPIGIAQPEMASNLILPPFPEEAKVYDAQGRNVFDDLENCNTIADAIMRFRDTASIFFYRKHLEGGLFLDLTGVDDSQWQKLHSLRLLAKKKFDFRTQKLGIAPIAHFFIGGIEINTEMETTLPGLFAVGEVTGGFHGANRMGGNALTECIVAGTIAGTNATSLSKRKGAVDVSDSVVKDRTPKWAWEKGQGVRSEYGNLFSKIKKTAWENAGIIRDLGGMEEGLELVSLMENELEALNPGNITEGLRDNRMRSALLTLRGILKAGLMRKESRGALYREDYPESDDVNWRRNIFISLDRSTDNLILEDRAID